MFKFAGKSPMQQYMNLVKIWALLLVVTFGGCAAGFHLDEPYSAKTSHNATLELAYSTMQKCGKHNSCEEFKGRFKLEEDGKMYERDIDGFFYHRFVDEGRKPMAAYITLSPNDKGIETPGFTKFLMFLGVIGGFTFLAGGLCLLLGSIDAEYAEKDYQQAQEYKERNRRYV